MFDSGKGVFALASKAYDVSGIYWFADLSEQGGPVLQQGALRQLSQRLLVPDTHCVIHHADRGQHQQIEDHLRERRDAVRVQGGRVGPRDHHAIKAKHHD